MPTATKQRTTTKQAKTTKTSTPTPAPGAPLAPGVTPAATLATLDAQRQTLRDRLDDDHAALHEAVARLNDLDQEAADEGVYLDSLIERLAAAEDTAERLRMSAGLFGTGTVLAADLTAQQQAAEAEAARLCELLARAEADADAQHAARQAERARLGAQRGSLAARIQQLASKDAALAAQRSAAHAAQGEERAAALRAQIAAARERGALARRVAAEEERATHAAEDAGRERIARELAPWPAIAAREALELASDEADAWEQIAGTFVRLLEQAQRLRAPATMQAAVNELASVLSLHPQSWAYLLGSASAGFTPESAVVRQVSDRARALRSRYTAARQQRQRESTLAEVRQAVKEAREATA